MMPRRASGALLTLWLWAAPASAAAPAVAAPPVKAAPAAAVPPPAPAAKPLQSVRGDHVRIEGKLYSPQALFVMTRRDETFRRDAIVPHYLAAPSGTAFLPYALQAGAVPVPAAAPRP
jgi:hypothetical protein